VDHKPELPEELKRIQNAGGFGRFSNSVSDGRINGNLNLSRAIGDLEYKSDPNLGPEKQIISVVPDISVHVDMKYIETDR
jgi:hypothetical protein